MKPALALATPAAVQRGRMITADHVLALLPEKRSRWWVMHRFLPEKKQKLGRLVFWWEISVKDVLFVPEVLPIVSRGRAA